MYYLVGLYAHEKIEINLAHIYNKVNFLITSSKVINF